MVMEQSEQEGGTRTERLDLDSEGEAPPRGRGFSRQFRRRGPDWAGEPVVDVTQEVALWDSIENKVLRGRLRRYMIPHDPIKITWTNTGANTDVTPDDDIEINVTYAKQIAIQIDTTHASNTSTDIDVNVMADVGDGVWDTEPYAEANIGDANVKTFLVTPGPRKIRLRADNNEAATTGYVMARVFYSD